MRRVLWQALALALATATVGCSAPSPPTASGGHVGTWERIGHPGGTISLRETDRGFEIDWRLASGLREIRCAAPGRCAEYFQGDKVYDWALEVSPDATAEGLLVRRVGTPAAPHVTPLSDVTRMVLDASGLQMSAYTIERNGETLNPPAGPYPYRKISDRPF